MEPDKENYEHIQNLKLALEQVKQSYHEIIKLNEQLKQSNSHLLEQDKNLIKNQKEIADNSKENQGSFEVEKELINDLTKESKKFRKLIGKEFTHLLTGDVKKFKQEMHKLLDGMQKRTMNNLVKNIIIGGYDKGQTGVLSGIFRDFDKKYRESFDPMILGGKLGNFLKGFLTPQARAIGGPVERNQPYLVGEYGPELFVPNTHGRINNNHSKANNISVNLTINTPNVDSFRKSQQQIINEIASNLKI